MSVTRRNGCADPMGAPPWGCRRSVSWPGTETNLDVETILAALILGVLAGQRGGGASRTASSRWATIRLRPDGITLSDREGFEENARTTAHLAQRCDCDLGDVGPAERGDLR